MLDVRSWDGGRLCWKAMYSVSGEERVEMPFILAPFAGLQRGTRMRLRALVCPLFSGKAADVGSEYREVQTGKIMN